MWESEPAQREKVSRLISPFMICLEIHVAPCTVWSGLGHDGGLSLARCPQGAETDRKGRAASPKLG